MLDAICIAPATLQGLHVGLGLLGWTVNAIELDLVVQSLRIELRNGGRVVTFDARNGKATITRELVEREGVAVGRRGDRCRVERLRTVFVGRTVLPGLRSGLRALSDYVADNASGNVLRADAREIFRPLLAKQSAEMRDEGRE